MRTATSLPMGKATKVRNASCCYCAGGGTEQNPLTDEHVIGRRFVPKGSFSGGWSLQIRACRQCNNAKSLLENDISAITLLPDIGQSHADPQIAQISARKAAGSRSMLTGRSVACSYVDERHGMDLTPGAKVSFTFVAPPQITHERVARLAEYHLQGFFYLITYNAETRLGGFIPGYRLWVNDAPRSDWGNSLQTSFAALTTNWDTRVEGAGARGFFRIAIRRDPTGAEVWSFALEWNKNLRAIGFFGDLGAASAHADALVPLKFMRLKEGLRFRAEVPLAPEEDRLFDESRLSLIDTDE